MADADAQQWNGDSARDANRETDSAPWNGGRSPSPRGAATPPRRERDRSQSPSRRNDDDYRGRSDRAGGDNNPGNNLHVSGLSNRCTDRDLEDAFGKYGTIQKAQVMYDPHSREPRGFAFVTYEKAEDAEAAITAMNGTEFQGRKITVDKARRGRARTPTPGRYFGPPKKGRMDGPPPHGGGGGYGGYRGGGPRGGRGGGGGYDDGYGMPMRGYPPPYPSRDPYDRYGGPPGRPFSPPPMRGDPYDRYGRGPPPIRDYPPRDYLPPPPRGGPGGSMDYPPRDFPPRGPPPPGDYPPPRGYRDLSPPPPRGAGRYDDLPPPPPRGPPGPGAGRYPDASPRPRYDDAGPPPRRY